MARGGKPRAQRRHAAGRAERGLGRAGAGERGGARRGARRKRQAQGTDDAHDRAEFGIAGFSKRLIETLAVQAGIPRNLSHAACPCDEAERVAHEIRVTGLERRRATFSRVLVKFIGTHAAYDRIDPETVTWRKK
jgi:hypothetical protein